MTKQEFTELTGEDPIDLFGDDWENEIENFADEYENDLRGDIYG